MTYICIKCQRVWTRGEPTTEFSGGLCEYCLTQYIREKQKNQGFHDCFRRATEMCARIECRYHSYCLRGIISDTKRE